MIHTPDATRAPAKETNARARRFWRRDAVCERYGNIPVSTLYSWMAAGHFPRPVRIGPRAVAWREEDLDAHDQTLPTSK
jgi:prophage regulatory protein